MRFATRLLLTLALAATATVLAPAAARAQMSCTQCAPTSSCDAECTICRGPFGQDGSCGRIDYSTCGEFGSGTRGCIRSGCTPNFEEISRSNRGTYGVGYALYCEHHRVDWVTKTDVNQCNTNSSYWTNSSCQDTEDGYKFGTSPPDCCDNSPGFTCNHVHSC